MLKLGAFENQEGERHTGRRGEEEEKKKEKRRERESPGFITTSI